MLGLRLLVNLHESQHQFGQLLARRQVLRRQRSKQVLQPLHMRRGNLRQQILLVTHIVVKRASRDVAGGGHLGHGVPP